MAAQGFCVVFISHKLDEVLEVADRISVLRRGQIVATTTPAETDRRTLARLMVGRELAGSRRASRGRTARGASTPGETVLELRGVGALGDKGCRRCGTSTSRSAPARRSASPASPAMVSASWPRSITGLRPATAGTIRIDGKTMTNRSGGGDRARRGRAYPRGPPGDGADRRHGSLRERHPARL